MVVGLVLVACGGDGAAPDSGMPAVDAGPDWPDYVGGARRARVVVPPSYDGTTPYPMIILLHGYSVNGTIQDAYWGMSRQARERDFLLVLPDGTEDDGGNRFWNSTPGIGFMGPDVDDVGYLRGLITEMKSLFVVDEERVYFAGHSNGGFMAYRMACEAAGEVAAIAGLAGGDFLADDACVPSQPVSVLHAHGTADETIPYDGTMLYPGAEAVVTRWATRAGCDTTMPETGAPLDLIDALPGAETRVTHYRSGCAAGHEVELWSIEGGEHIPAINGTWTPTLVDWLLRHRR